MKLRGGIALHPVALFDAKTHFSQYVGRAEAGEETSIMRHNKPVAKILPLTAKSALPTKVIPPFVQRSFNMGPLLISETNMNHLAADLDNLGFIKLNERLEREAKKRKKSNETA